MPLCRCGTMMVIETSECTGRDKHSHTDGGSVSGNLIQAGIGETQNL
jgi:hypothetical protein